MKSDWANALAEEIKRERGAGIDEIPEGFERPADIARKLGIRDSSVQKMLKEGVEAGRIEMRKFKIRKNGFRASSVIMFRIKSAQPVPHPKTKR